MSSGFSRGHRLAAASTQLCTWQLSESRRRCACLCVCRAALSCCALTPGFMSGSKAALVRRGAMPDMTTTEEGGWIEGCEEDSETERQSEKA